MFTKRELFHLTITVLILSFVFGWNDGQTIFVAEHWLANFIKIVAIVLLALLAHELGHKFVAKRYDLQTEYKINNIERIWFNTKLKKPLPLWAILSVLLTFLSRGQLPFTSIGTTTVTADEKMRIGRKFTFPTGYEEALILLAGPFANLLLILLSKLAGNALGTEFNTFMYINLIIAFWSLVPLPGFDGNAIYFGSRYVYFFGVSFFVISLLFHFFSIILALVLGLLLAGLTTFLYYFGMIKLKK